jgi:hypothetical protein
LEPFEVIGFVKTKSKALKIYSDLKKVNQPICRASKVAEEVTTFSNLGGHHVQKRKRENGVPVKRTVLEGCGLKGHVQRT